jgi:hypothetical protein
MEEYVKTDFRDNRVYRGCGTELKPTFCDGDKYELEGFRTGNFLKRRIPMNCSGKYKAQNSMENTFS